MRVRGPDGRLHHWKLTGHLLANRSSFHVRARLLLEELYPVDQRLEEVSIPGCDLTADFYLPARKLMVEVMGQQHYQFVAHFHGNHQGFRRGQSNDQSKRQFCQDNNITLVELPYDEDEEQWKQRILDAMSRGGSTS